MLTVRPTSRKFRMVLKGLWGTASGMVDTVIREGDDLFK